MSFFIALFLYCIAWGVAPNAMKILHVIAVILIIVALAPVASWLS